MAEREERDDRRDDGDRPRRRRDAEDPPRGRRNEVNTKVPCPKCGGMSGRSGTWPWYLGTVGAIMCKAVICNECGHEYEHLWTKYTRYPVWLSLASWHKTLHPRARPC